METNDDVLHFLEWFFANANFGPADGDVREMLERNYEATTGKKVPEGYSYEH